MRRITKKRKMRLSIKVLAVWMTFAFIFSSLMPPAGYAQVASLPAPGTMVPLSDPFLPVMLQGIRLYPDNPLRFDFIIDLGDPKLKGKALEEESHRLIKHFLASLTIPEEDLWVNLSPHEADRIISEAFGQTEMGRDVLAQDYLLKQLTASLMYPQEELGQRFWERIRQKAYEVYGTTDIPFNTFHKVWILPDKAKVYESSATNTAFVIESRFKVMLEQDYLAMEGSKNSSESWVMGFEPQAHNSKPTTHIESEILRELILPEIENEVNHGKHFAPLRQIYQSLILATWYKNALKGSVLDQVYVDQKKIQGVDVADKNIKQKIYQQYLAAYRQGVYNDIQEDYDQRLQQVLPRKYFSGGIPLLEVAEIIDVVSEADHFDAAMFAALEERTSAGRAVVVEAGVRDMAMLVPEAMDSGRPIALGVDEVPSGEAIAQKTDGAMITSLERR